MTCVVIATCHWGDVDAAWMLNFEQVHKPGPRADGAPGWRHVASLRRLVTKARNELVEAFLALPATEATHLCFWDDDVLLPPEGVLRLLAHDLPIVSGLYVQREPPFLPVAFRTLDDGAGHLTGVPVTRFAPGLNTVDVVGAGCLLVRREVFERMASPWFALSLPTASDPGQGEDAHFCRQAAALGYPIVLDFGVQCGHLTRRAVGWADFKATQATQATQAAQAASGHGGWPYATAEQARLGQAIRPWPPAVSPASPASAAAPTPSAAPHAPHAPQRMPENRAARRHAAAGKTKTTTRRRRGGYAI